MFGVDILFFITKNTKCKVALTPPVLSPVTICLSTQNGMVQPPTHTGRIRETLVQTMVSAAGTHHSLTLGKVGAMCL